MDTCTVLWTKPASPMLPVICEVKWSPRLVMPFSTDYNKNVVFDLSFSMKEEIGTQNLEDKGKSCNFSRIYIPPCLVLKWALAVDEIYRHCCFCIELYNAVTVILNQSLVHSTFLLIRPKKKVFDWRNPTDPIYPADPTYFYQFLQKIKIKINKF